jgi:hypothetical protein
MWKWYGKGMEKHQNQAEKITRMCCFRVFILNFEHILEIFDANVIALHQNLKVKVTLS